MRTLPTALANALQFDTLTLAMLITLTRKDGTIVRLANHDRDVTIDGIVWFAAAALEAGSSEQRQGLSASSLGFSGALSSAAISDNDLRAGRWLGARVDVAITDWRAPTFVHPVWRGTIAETIQRDGAFELSLEGQEAGLNATIGRRFMRQCDARLGDGRCGVDLTDPRFAGDASVEAIDGDRCLTVSLPTGLLIGQLTGGRIRFTSGAMAGVDTIIASARLSSSALYLSLSSPTALPVSVGDAVRLEVTCDGALATCRDVFDNVINHRGCPQMPGQMAAFAGPETDLRVTL